jgi:hypothetical protein
MTSNKIHFTTKILIHVDPDTERLRFKADEVLG